MAGFTMCAACQAEYDDPADRRFHAQPNACPECGPQLAWRDPDGGRRGRRRRRARAAVVDALAGGAVVAVKGIGGYHLAVDATDADGGRRAAPAQGARRQAVRGDGARRRRPPRGSCELDAAAVAALPSPRRPIVLAPRAAPARRSRDAVAPGLPDLGRAPALHARCTTCCWRGVGRPLVMTSGNLQRRAHRPRRRRRRRLGSGRMVDGFLTHDRADPHPLRRLGGAGDAGAGCRCSPSRGYAPEPLRLPVRRARAGARGRRRAEVHDRGRQGRRSSSPSHHIGDLEHLADLPVVPPGPRPPAARCTASRPRSSPTTSTRSTCRRSSPIDLDLPDRRGAAPPRARRRRAWSSTAARRRCSRSRSTASATGRTARSGAASSWSPTSTAFERVGHLRPVPMPGGVAAIREPWRMAAVWAAAGPADATQSAERRPGRSARSSTSPSAADDPVTTSMGRLFDAVAALLGGRRRGDLRGPGRDRAGGAGPHASTARDARRLRRHGDGRRTAATCRPRPDAARGRARRRARARHRRAGARRRVPRGDRRAAAALAAELPRDHGLDTVVAHRRRVPERAPHRGRRVRARRAPGSGARPRAVPPNDGGISIGQAAIAAARY